MNRWKFAEERKRNKWKSLTLLLTRIDAMVLGLLACCSYLYSGITNEWGWLIPAFYGQSRVIQIKEAKPTSPLGPAQPSDKNGHDSFYGRFFARLCDKLTENPRCECTKKITVGLKRPRVFTNSPHVVFIYTAFLNWDVCWIVKASVESLAFLFLDMTCVCIVKAILSRTLFYIAHFSKTRFEYLYFF